MASITLEVQTAELTTSFGRDYGPPADERWVITSIVKLAWPDKLQLGTGEELGGFAKPGEIEMRLALRNTDPELVEWATEQTKTVDETPEPGDRAVYGTVTYHAGWNDRDGLDQGAASLFFDIYTPPEVMASLVRFAENGRFVRRLTLTVGGLDYGWAPDGSMKKWADNAQQKLLPIRKVDFDLPLHEQPLSGPIPGEPTTAVGADLAPVLKESLMWLKGAVWLLAAIGASVLFAQWR
jgi:hypothetical protein